MESVAVRWEWQSAGQVVLVDGKLVFPPVRDCAGVYRFLVTDPAEVVTGVYFGEADRLRRRFRQYRSPGRSQKTNLRLNPILVNALMPGGRVTVDVVIEAQVIRADGGVGALDLSLEAARVLVERAAEVAARVANAPVLNR